MDRFKELMDKAKQARTAYEKTMGTSPKVVVISWRTYEDISNHDFCRTLCGTPLRIDPFCPDETIIFLGE